MNSSKSFSPLHGNRRPGSKAALPKSGSRPRDAFGVKPLHGLIAAVVADLGLGDKLLEAQACLAWNEAVGPALARHTQPVRVRHGRLEVEVPSAVWRHQLNFMKQDIVTRINHALGQEVLEDLVLINGRRSEKSA